MAKMEDVLDFYQRPYDPLCPVVCIDETNKQLIQETRIPCEPGQPEKLDYEYERNGVANVFMISEPLGGKRETIVNETRNAIDFAHVLKFTSDVMYPHAEKIIALTDNLNIHEIASLYKAFSPEEAHRLSNRFEWHYTSNFRLRASSTRCETFPDWRKIALQITGRNYVTQDLRDIEITIGDYNKN